MDGASRVHTKNGSRGRGARARGRRTQVEDVGYSHGCGRDSSRDVKRPQAIDKMTIVDIRSLPKDLPLETPVQAKRMRYDCKLTSKVAPASPPHIMSPPVEDTVVKSTSQPADEQPLALASSTPSPGQNMECDGNLATRLCPLQSPKEEENSQNNIICESEESEESDEEEMVAPLIPRTFRINMDTPEDDDVTTTATVPTHLDFPTPEMGAVRPYDLHDFEWNSFPDPPISPNLRREKFSSSNVGPTAPCVDPYDTFIGIWDWQFMEYIASETNRYAQEVIKKMILNQSLTQKCLMRDWRPTTADELYTYFAIILAMGVVVKNNICEYWDSTPNIFYTPGFKTHMTAKRFQLLNKCLHFNSNENMCALELDASEANLYKIEPVLSHLNSKFQSMYNMSQNIALDESLLLWKGVSDINQFIANKAAAEGIKTYEICEPQTGYMWRFEVHTHGHSSQKQSPQEKLETFTTTLVLRLIQGLEYKGHTLWMDSLYSSPVLARRLKSLGFDCVGTFRTNRQFVPTALSNLTKANMRRGGIRGLTSGDVDLMVWRDLNRVAMISTYHGNIKTNDKAYPKPALIADYNIVMGGVDRKDQMLAMYPIERKQTRVWYKQFFRRLLNVSVLNCFILVKKSSSSIYHRSFRTSLILSVLKRHSSLSVVPAVPSNSNIFKIKDHHLKMFPLLPVTRDRHRRRRVCTICKKRISTFCVGCDKAVCMTPCFVALHQ